MPPGVCELTVSYKRKNERRKKIQSSKDIDEFAREFLYPDGSIEYSELFFVMLLDRSHRAFAYKLLSSGGMTGTVVDPRLLFQTALLCHASVIVLVHNHPSGNTKPSESDMHLTKKIREAGLLLEITVLDHVIITSDSYYSFSEEGFL